MNAILGYSQILLRDGALHPFQRDALATISSSCDHLLHLINEILDLSKIDAGRMELETADFDLVSLVRELTALFQHPCEEKQLGLRVEGLDGLRALSVRGDVGKLRQVLINLLGNAVKFTQRGRVTLRLERGPQDTWKIEVSDTGIGVPLEAQRTIFKPFQQGPGARGHGGTGLGLTIASRQVELMGGKLEVRSDPGAGSTFFFTLALPAAASRASAVEAREVERLAPGSQVRALIVDDIRENREVLSTLLAAIGCEIVLAENGRQALEAVSVSHPDIVFMDMRLPEIDGLEATRRIVSDHGAEGLKVVAMSASALEHEREMYLKAGCDDFIAKPFRDARLYECLRHLLGVDFEYKAPPDGGESAPLLDLGRIVLPEDLVTRLMMAAELHSATVLKSCLREVEETGPPGRRLAEHLREFLASYDMEMIQKIAAQIAVAPNVATPPFRMSREKILIVDDTPTNIDLLTAALEPRGYEILAAPGGEAGLKIAAKALPDLILLDVVMPGRDGFAICRELKAEEATREIPVLFITAKQETASVVNGFRVGAVDYILKPFQADEVVGRVETHLKISRLTRELQRKNAELEDEVTRRRAAEDAREKADARLSTFSAREAQRWGLAGFIGQSGLIRKILQDVERLHHFANTSVLITGESGTGKELGRAQPFTTAVPRASAPFTSRELRGHPLGAGGVDALRSFERLLHRRDVGPQGVVRARRWRHALSR
ncbi:MAG: response regulator [Chthoniobacter sp.]